MFNFDIYLVADRDVLVFDYLYGHPAAGDDFGDDPTRRLWVPPGCGGSSSSFTSAPIRRPRRRLVQKGPVAYEITATYKNFTMCTNI